jgi:predicted small lipoprotein YifL
MDARTRASMGPTYGATHGGGARDTSGMRSVAGAFIAAVLALSLAACGSAGKQVTPSASARAVDAAQAIFGQKQAAGEDMSTGPCISESLTDLPDWVADVAHDPREPIDDEPANQCQRYRSGDAHHFVELNVDGALIRAE